MEVNVISTTDGLHVGIIYGSAFASTKYGCENSPLKYIGVWLIHIP